MLNGPATWTEGTLALGHEGVIDNNDSFTIAGDVTSNGTGGTATFNNLGTLVKSAGTEKASIAAVVNNSGRVEVQSGVLEFARTYTQTDGITVLNGGDLRASSSLELLGGSLAGEGTVDAFRFHNGATISPGFSTGVITVDGQYFQLLDGELAMEIGGTTPGAEHDQLQVTASANLDGLLRVDLVADYIPQANDQFQILTAQSISGNFSTTELPRVTAAAGLGLDLWDAIGRFVRPVCGVLRF